MKTIGVDIDDTIAVHIPEIIKWSNERFGTQLTMDTYKEWWGDFWDVEIDEIMARAKEFHAQTVTQYQRQDNSLEVLQKLSKDYRLVIITARAYYNIDPTYQWLEEHYKGIFEEVHFVPIWEDDNKVTKAELCKQIGADYLIDDIPRHCNAAAEAGVTGLLFGGYNWSKDHIVHPDVVRVDDWKAVERYFDAAR